MATRRRYKEPKAFRDGGRVIADDIMVPDDAPAAGSEENQHRAGIEDVPASPMFTVATPSADDDPLMKALNAQKRAEELQRQAARQPTQHEAYVDSLPGLSDRKKQFLKQNPALVRNDVAPIAARAYQEALAAGIADDTPEIEKHIVERTIQHFERAEHQRQLSSASARPTEENRVTHQVVADLQHEADEVAAAELPAPQPAPAPAPRRSIPVSAPVSREVPMSTSGERRQTETTLNPDERQIAHVSFPDLPPAQAEYRYWQNRQKMRAMQADGRLPPQGR